jgi:hypothetical protein
MGFVCKLKSRVVEKKNQKEEKEGKGNRRGRTFLQFYYA